jgi:hypothetical protein
MATDMRSPRSNLEFELEQNPNYALPSVSRWSDATFLRWYYYGKQDRTPLPTDETGQGRIPVPKYVIMTTVINQNCMDTFGFIWTSLKILQEKGFGKKQTFAASSREGAALLACPNGNAVVRFLAEHKVQFGIAYVDTIDVWIASWGLGKPVWYMGFKIAMSNVDPTGKSDQHGDGSG